MYSPSTCFPTVDEKRIIGKFEAYQIINGLSASDAARELRRLGFGGARQAVTR